MVIRSRVALAVSVAVLAWLPPANAHAGWPPSAGADLSSAASWPNDPGYAQLWSYFSYLPAQTSGTGAYSQPDLTLGASGMSIDKAWESTTGSSLVKIAVIDSGILWDEPDLIDQAWLNAGELTGASMPRTAKGLACTGLAGYDCNGDGVFSVADYANDPRITPLVAGDHCVDPTSGHSKPEIAGDLNHNCVLDAGDLIELFSDGVDDDGNGYTDDIAGWDFFKNDNNPYDDTRDGHGTKAALTANAQANNGVGVVGVCPGCRFLALRVGNSRVADSNDLAKALIYAADNVTPTGADVAAVSLDVVNLTRFARAAIDYAYAKNVVVVASIGDDNSREHSLPATYNHTVPVHAIGYDGASFTSSTTFLDYVNCTGFGGQLALSASANASGCSDEAAAATAGVAGLLYSYAEQAKLAPALTAEEVGQLLKTTADVVNVPASRDPATSATYYESLPGFSQRFGYGRVNAAAAVAAISAGQVPPEVDIVSPGWFATLYAGEASGPVPVLGRIVAARAVSYDVSVEWAPGVEPLDADFVPLTSAITNVPGQIVSGGEAPLALLDPTTLNTAHAADPDYPQHENDRTITVRVQAVAHYASGDVTGEARRTIAIVNAQNGGAPGLVPGFPVQLSGSIEGGAKLADISGDGVRDIILATNDGRLHVLTVASGEPAEVAGFPYALLPIDGLDPTSPIPALPSYLTAPAYMAGSSGGITQAVTRESVDGTPAVGDITGDVLPEIVFASWAGTLYVVDHTGANAPGWPQRLPLVPSCPDDPSSPVPPGDCMNLTHDLARGAYASPVLADFDGTSGNGKLEIVLAAFDGNVYVFNGDGTQRAGFPVRVHSLDAFRAARVMSTPAVVDFNGDGVPDILVGSNETLGSDGGTGFYFIVDGRGTLAPTGAILRHWPIEIPSLYSSAVVGEGTTASPVALNLTGGATPDALLQGNGTGPVVLPADPGDQTGSAPPASQLPATDGGMTGFAPLSQFGALSTATPDQMLPLFSHPSVGDLDQDGTPDIVMSGGSQSLLANLSATTATPFQNLLGMWSGKTGAMMPGSPVVLEDFSRMTSQAIADITGDSYPEVIAGTGGYFVHAVDACGREAEGWPKFTGGWTMGTPAVGDVTGDHMLEVVVGTREGYVYAWSTAGTDSGVIEWESFHHDNGNTGSYSTPLGQGTLGQGPVAATPLACGQRVSPDASTKMDPTSTSSGGCGCTLVRSRNEAAGPAVVGLAALVWGRRRARGRVRRRTAPRFRPRTG